MKRQPGPFLHRAWTAVVRRLRRPPAPGCTIARNRFGSYCVPASSSHRPAARVVLRGDVYEPDTIRYMARHCGRGDIVHAGTYFGDFLPALSRTVDGTALIWAFEPNSENHRCARATLELNGIRNVRLSHAAVGSRPHRLFVQVEDPEGQALGGASHVVAAATEGVGEAVNILTVDETVPPERQVSIVQLDVEGYEQEALAGALATIRRCAPILILEVRPGSTLVDGAWFAENILRLGYRRADALHSNVVYRMASTTSFHDTNL